MRRSWLPPLSLLVPLLWLFRRALFQGQVFAYRDAAHYYFPLYAYVQDRWREGLPLWNPLEGLGQPLLGDPTAAVLYPAQAVFWLPLPYPVCFAIYVVGHLWLAGYGVYRLARCHRAAPQGALLAGVSYELSGQILFQYCNPIYCVGAAWLPWAVLGLTLVQRRDAGAPHVAMLCTSLSMMLLGGDPQLAYYVLLLGVLWIVVAKFSVRHAAGQLARLVGVGVAVLLLCAVQTLPTYEWVRNSDRAVRDGPRSLDELSWDTASTVFFGSPLPRLDLFWQRPPPRSHLARSYEFSVGPWRWAELIWPHAYGTPFPTYRRWLSGLPGTSRSWTPSLYLGLVPLVLALSRLRFWTGSRVVRWWSWVVAISALAALGGYGVGWFVNEVRYLADPQNFKASNLLPGCGGVYWLMNVLIPGHQGFRYPAKLWTVTSLGIALLAARAWPRFRTRTIPLERSCAVILGISCLMAVGAALPTVREAMSRLPAHPIFGPLQSAAAQRELIGTCVHAAVVCGCFLVSLRLLPRRWVPWSLLWLTVLELSMVQAKLVQTVPGDLDAQPIVAVVGGDVIYRCRPAQAYPPDWKRTSSPMRFTQLQRHDLKTLMPKHHLKLGVRSVQSSAPMKSADAWVLAELAAEVAHSASGSRQVPHRDWVDLLGADYLLTTAHDPLLTGAESQAFQDSGAHLVAIPNTHAFPRAWLVHNWRVFDELSAWDHQSLVQRTRQTMVDEQGSFWDFRRFAAVETSVNLPSPSWRDGTSGHCAVQRADGQRVTLTVDTPSAGILVLADQYYPGWEVWVAEAGGGNWIQQPLLRVNRVMRGVYLSPGQHGVEFRYRPRSVAIGVAASVLAWTLLVGYCAIPWCRRRASTT